MDKQKSFWKKYEFLIVASATLFAIYLIVLFNQKINFFLGNELIVNLNPHQKSIFMHYGDISQADFGVAIDNIAYCKASCDYSFNDRSKNELIENGFFIIEKKQHVIKSYNLSVKRLGSGQDIYSFDIKCRSIPSFICLTKSPEKSRSSLVTVNYDLTEIERQLKEKLKQNMTLLLEELSQVDILHQQLNQKYYQLSFKINLNNLTRQKIQIDDAYDKFRISVENLKSLWSQEDYASLNKLLNESFFEVLLQINNSVEDLDFLIGKTLTLHNELLSGFEKFSKDLSQLNQLVYQIEDNILINETSANTQNFNLLAASLSDNTFESYGNVLNEFSHIVEKQNSIINASKMPAARLFFDLLYSVGFQNNMLCNLSQDCRGNISVNSAIKDANDFFLEYPNAQLSLSACSSLKELKQKYADAKNDSLEKISTGNIIFPNDADFNDSAKDYQANIIRGINNSYFDSFQKIKNQSTSSKEVIEIATSFLPKNKTINDELNYNLSMNFSLYILSKVELANESLELLNKCSRLEEPRTIRVAEIDLEPISAIINYTIIPKIDTNLSGNPPICCVFYDCKPCCREDSCRNDPKTFPIMFLHGHSLAKDNSPEFSLDAFNQLQSELQQDGYLDAGIISLYSKNEPLQKGVWGMSGKPITVKTSYYYDAFRKEDKYIVVPTKSENIDTYALRLKDLIDIIKDRTNKPKVNIIAHSMGGLVARRYIQIFGEGDVDKLIMIAAPNHGISGSVSDYCGLIGENRECQDMNSDSLFINKLNDPLKQPKNVKLYAIIGQGCKMKQGQGDGVVLVQDAELNNARLYYVNGTCPGFFGDTLHTEILDIGKYPETYNIIKEILKV